MMKATTMTSTASRQENCSWRKRSYQFMRALRAQLRNSLPPLLDGDENAKEVRCLAYVVHAHHGDAGAMRGGHRGERADGALRAGVAAGEVADECLARGADDHRRDRLQLLRA